MTSLLVIDDDADLRAFLRRVLGVEGFEVREAGTGREALDALREPADLVLLGVGLPDMDGLDLCRRLRQDTLTAGVPVMLLAGRSRTADEVAGLAAGADDYITKPFDTLELVARARTLLRRNADMRAVSPLTSLPGNTRINQEVARRTGLTDDFALCHVDIDNFKAFNDRYGWIRGDGVIMMLATVLKQVADGMGDPPVFVGHVGGDDFVLLCTPEQVDPLCQGVLDAFDLKVRGHHDPEDVSANHLVVVDRQGVSHQYPLASVSIGVATTDRRNFEDPRDVVAVATEMKSVAKGRNGSAYSVDRRRNGHVTD